MIDGTYDITMRMPNAIHDGSAVLSTSGDTLSASLVLDGIGGLRKKGTHAGDEFQLVGIVNMYHFGRVKYRIEGLVAGNLLKATCATDKGTFDITGSRTGTR